jgi:hypothetical protein
MPKMAVGLLAVVLAAGLIAAGCGGDDDDDTTAATTTTEAAATGEPLSKAEFIEQGDEICADANKELRELEQQEFGGGAPSEQEASEFGDELADNIQSQIDGLRGLTPPEGDEDEIAQTLDAGQEGVDQLREAETPTQTPGLAEASRMLRDYGFEECGQ